MPRLLAFLLTATASVAVAQPGPRGATPIDRDALERLNLRADWNVTIPITGRQDGLARVQPVDDQQVFVQTKSGLLVALDARTGRQQWKYKFATASAADYPVAVTDKYCFAVGLGTLYCFDRYTGAVLRKNELRETFPHREETPVAGPTADSRAVYLLTASGYLVRYDLPPELQPAGEGTALPKPKLPPPPIPEYRPSRQEDAPERLAGTNRDQASPSISALHSVVPPYELDRRYPVPSLAILPPTVQPPYKLVPDHLKYKQPTASVSSQSALYRLEEDSSLRPKESTFKPQWRYVMPQRSITPPLLVENAKDGDELSRLWLSTEGKTLAALSKTKGKAEVLGKFDGLPLAPIVGPFAFAGDQLLGFIPLDTGTIMALDLGTGGGSVDSVSAAVVYHWKAQIGGQFNHPILAGKDAVYASGDRNGCVKLDAHTGDVKWKTEPELDQVLAVNRDFVYLRDGRGRLAVVPVEGKPNPRTGVIRPSATLDLPAFTVAVSNQATDRILLGGDNGLLVCLREATAAYAKPARIAPPPIFEPKKAAAPPMPPMGMGEPKN